MLTITTLAFASTYRGAPDWGLRSHPSNLIRFVPAKGAEWFHAH
jgi:hypothetical protein